MNNWQKLLLTGSVIIIGKYIYDTGYDKGYSQCDIDHRNDTVVNLNNPNRKPHSEKKKLWDLGKYSVTIQKKDN